MNTHNRQHTDTGLVVLRVSLGAMWLAHAMLKWQAFTITGFTAWMESQGLPGFMAWPVFLLEMIGGIAIIAGYYGRYFSVALLPVILVAAWTHIPNGWVHTSSGGGWEYPVFLAAASLAHYLLGDGQFTIRRMMQEKTMA